MIYLQLVSTENARARWLRAHPRLAGLVGLVALIGVLVSWHEYRAHQTTPTFQAVLTSDVRIENLYSPFDHSTVPGNSALTLVCEVRAIDSIGAYGALASGNRFFNVGTGQIQSVPGRRLPDCGVETVSLPPHANDKTRFYVQPSPDGDGS